MNEPKLKKAMDTLEYLSQDEQARMLYEARQKYLHDEASRLCAAETAMDRGLKEGRKEGRKEGMLQAKQDIACKMLALELEPALIAQATGLTEEEIHQLQNP